MTEVKERPILFSAPMVRAILNGAKTQTRRIVKPQPPAPEAVKSMSGDTYHWFNDVNSKPAHFRVAGAVWAVRKLDYPTEIVCPYGAPKERFWLRETYYQVGHWEPVDTKRTRGGRLKWRFVSDSEDIRFDAPDSFRKGRHSADPATSTWHKRLGRFMSRRYSRIDLEIVNVRVERLNDISEADALAEGGYCPFCEDEPCMCIPKWSAVEWYADLWNHINGPGSWELNPWVWCIEFRRLRP